MPLICIDFHSSLGFHMKEHERELSVSGADILEAPSPATAALQSTIWVHIPIVALTGST